MTHQPGTATATEPPADAVPAERRYSVTWTLTEHHSHELSTTELAHLLGVTADEVLAAADDDLPDLGQRLADGLAAIEGAGTYDGVTYRNDIQVGAL